MHDDSTAVFATTILPTQTILLFKEEGESEFLLAITQPNAATIPQIGSSIILNAGKTYFVADIFYHYTPDAADVRCCITAYLQPLKENDEG